MRRVITVHGEFAKIGREVVHYLAMTRYVQEGSADSQRLFQIPDGRWDPPVTDALLLVGEHPFKELKLFLEKYWREFFLILQLLKPKVTRAREQEIYFDTGLLGLLAKELPAGRIGAGRHAQL